MSVASRQATKIWPSSNVWNGSILRSRAVSCSKEKEIMDAGHFYFLTDQYFIDFPDKNLMRNHETINGVQHNRPCFFAFEDKTTGLYWMIPFSSKTKKFHDIYQNKIEQSGICDTILFGDVLGYEKAFLIQNMCPITQKYIRNEYMDATAAKPVRLNSVFERDLIKKAKKVLALQRKGVNLIFPDVLKIEQALLS